MIIVYIAKANIFISLKINIFIQINLFAIKTEIFNHTSELVFLPDSSKLFNVVRYLNVTEMFIVQTAGCHTRVFETIAGTIE